MAVNVYKYNVNSIVDGYITIIQDTTAYNNIVAYIANAAYNEIVCDTGVLTSKGTELLSAAPLSSVYVSILRSVPLDTDAYNNLAMLIPNLIDFDLNDIMTISTSYQYFNMDYNDSKYVYTGARYYSKVADLRLYTPKLNNSTNTFNSMKGAVAGVYDSGATVNTMISVDILIANDDMTAARTISLYSNANAASAYKKQVRFIGDSSDVNATTLSQLKTFLSDLEPYTPVVPSTDPYAAGGDSTTGGGGGSFTDSGTDVGLPGLPSINPNNGFMNAFSPSAAELQSFASWLWNTLDLTTLKQIYSNPMEAVIGLSMVAVSPTTGASATVSLGNIASSVSMPVISNRFKQVDCGSLTVGEYWGAYLDYSPYTEVSIYLPYVGVQQLDTNEVMGKTIHVMYHVDVLSGACIAMLECGGKVLYHFPGQCGTQIPVTASSFGSILQSALGTAASAIQSIASQASGNFSTVGEVATSVFSGAKTRVQKSGSLGSAAAFGDNQTPFLIIQRPKQCKPADQNQFSGYPAYITYTLSDLVGTGYTEVESVRLTNVPATADELTELEAVLKAGVIL